MLKSTFIRLKDEVATLRGTIESLVRGFQHDSASRVATPTRAVADEENRVNRIQPNLLSSSSNAVLMTIAGIQRIFAKKILADYIVQNVKQFPQNLVINVNDPERGRKRILDTPLGTSSTGASVSISPAGDPE